MPRTGFEPGSQPREGRILDRTILPWRYVVKRSLVFKKVSVTRNCILSCSLFSLQCYTFDGSHKLQLEHLFSDSALLRMNHSSIESFARTLGRLRVLKASRSLRYKLKVRYIRTRRLLRQFVFHTQVY